MTPTPTVLQHHFQSKRRQKSHWHATVVNPAPFGEPLGICKEGGQHGILYSMPFGQLRSHFSRARSLPFLGSPVWTHTQWLRPGNQTDGSQGPSTSSLLGKEKKKPGLNTAMSDLLTPHSRKRKEKLNEIGKWPCLKEEKLKMLPYSCYVTGTPDQPLTKGETGPSLSLQHGCLRNWPPVSQTLN